MIDIEAERVCFFDYWLKGEANGVSINRVRLFGQVETTGTTPVPVQHLIWIGMSR